MFFGAGVITGIVAFLLFSVILAYTDEKGNKSDNGITWFEEPGEVFDESAFKVFQVIADDAALVNPSKGEMFELTDKVYLLVNDEEKYYYDNELVNVPKGYQARQMGVYRYPTKRHDIKTVPVIQIIEKNKN